MIWCEDTPLASESRNRPQSPQLLSNNVYTSSIFKYGHTRIKKSLTYRVAVTSHARDSPTSQDVTQGSEVRVLLTAKLTVDPAYSLCRSMSRRVQFASRTIRNEHQNPLQKYSKLRKSSQGAEEGLSPASTLHSAKTDQELPSSTSRSSLITPSARWTNLELQLSSSGSLLHCNR
ncbi:hypothetical protein J6590_046585 [Homalodisca vitripennis]|nr:hypothetical protein J6590_075481 [Homalodisca vitripennis]KAG8326313.1 hypothetical protein J6590_046585 [Homalodisca vitripennis]